MRRLALTLIALGLLLHVRRVEAQHAASLTALPSASWLTALSVAVRKDAIEAPDSIGSGWTRLHLDKEKGRHVVVLFRLRDGVEPTAFLAALDTARMTPSTGLAVGGPEVVRNAEVVMDLTPGRYVLACMVRDTIGARRHLVTGESKAFVVTPRRSANRATAKPPSASTEVHMMDFAYRAPERWRRGAQWVRVSNEGKEDHLLLIARLRDGATLREWATATLTDTVVAKPLTGVARTSPGGVVYLPLSLSPGRYVLHCRVQHSVSGMLHEKMGMFKEITVE
ncbi:MAG: hypothetical protein ABI601_20075 [bacterium]